MRQGFTSGMIIGSVVGATMGMFVGADQNVAKTKKKMMRSGRTMVRKSGKLMTDVVDMFR